MHKTHRELQVASSAVLKAQYLALDKSEEARLGRRQFESVEEQLDLARGNFTSVEASKSKAVSRSKKDLARLQKECDLNRPRTASAESAVTVPNKELEVVTAKASDLELENATLRKEYETSSKTHAKIEK